MAENYNKIRVRTKEEWIKVLNNEESLGKTKMIEILRFVYMSNQHLSNGTKIARYMNEGVGAINLIVSSFGKRVLELLNLPEIKGESDQNRRWNIPFMTVDDLNHNGLFV